MNIIKNDVIVASDIERLRVSVGWEPLTDRYIKALPRSYANYSVKEQNQLVAFARVLSDGELYAFIVDVLVDSSAQKRGIGKTLIEYIITDLKNNGIRLTQLTFDPALVEFYKKCGFDIISAGTINNG